jgi:hypothetical protein
MRAPNIHNYEEFIIDYFDGNLSAEESADLLLFLEQHPNIKSEFEMFSAAPLTELEEVNYEAKDKLKKGLAINNETIVAYLEKDLPLAEIKEFESAVQKNIQLKKEVALFQKTFLKTDATIIYANKKNLKRDSRVVWLFAYAAAASLVFFLLYNALNFSNENTKIKQELAHGAETEKSNKKSSIKNSILQNIKEAVPVKVNGNKKITLPKNNFLIKQAEESKEQVKELQEEKTPEKQIATNSNKENTEEDKVKNNQLPEEESITTLYAQNNTTELTNTLNDKADVTLADIAKQKINKFLNKKVGYSKKQKADGTLTAYQFSAGDFEFSKTLKSKK